MMRKLALALTGATAAALLAGTAWAGNLPSSKAAASVGNLTALGTACAQSGDVPNDETADCPILTESDDTGWVTVQTTFIKTPNGKELAFDVALQCGLVTFTEVKSKGGEKDTSQAKARVRVRVRIQDVANNTLEVIPGTVRYAKPLEEDDPDNGVTYCYRLQRLSAIFQGIFQDLDDPGVPRWRGEDDNIYATQQDCIDAGNSECTLITVVGTCLYLDPVTGNIVLDPDCLEPEELALLLETLTATAFNFLSANENPGIKKIDVQARATADTALFGTQNGSAKGEAFVGLGSMLVETVRMVKDADGTPVIQELD